MRSIIDNIHLLTGGTMKPCSGVCLLPVCKHPSVIISVAECLGSYMSNGTLMARVRMSPSCYKYYADNNTYRLITGAILEHPVDVLISKKRTPAKPMQKDVACAYVLRDTAEYTAVIRVVTANGHRDIEVPTPYVTTCRAHVHDWISENMERIQSTRIREVAQSPGFWLDICKEVTGESHDAYMCMGTAVSRIESYMRAAMSLDKNKTVDDLVRPGYIEGLPYMPTTGSLRSLASFRVKVTPVRLCTAFSMESEWRSAYKDNPIDWDTMQEHIWSIQARDSKHIYSTKASRILVLCKYRVTAVPEDTVDARIDKFVQRTGATLLGNAEG